MVGAILDAYLHSKCSASGGLSHAARRGGAESFQTRPQRLRSEDGRPIHNLILAWTTCTQDRTTRPTASGRHRRGHPSDQPNGQKWRVLRATFNETIDTHCAGQKFYFDDKGMLQRHDYFNDVAKGNAAHYCMDYRTF